MKNTWSDFILSESIIEYPKSDPSDRQIRNSISKLRKQGIVFISVKSDKYGYRKYVRFEQATDEQRKEYAAVETKKWKTTYFNLIVPVGKGMIDNQLHELMGRLGT